MSSGLFYAISWLVFAFLIGVISLPITARVFSTQSPNGAAFSIPLGLAGLTLGTFWLGRISLPIAPHVSLVLIAGLAFVLNRRYDSEIPLRDGGDAALVFTAGFGLVLLIQSITPDITATGETYWNFTLIQSLLRTAQLPPQDPWFAGEAVRYYYGGHLLVASIAELLNTPGRYAFALGKAVVFGTLLSVSYGVASSIVATQDVSYRSAGWLGVFFVGIASNFYTPIWFVLVLLPDGVSERFADVIGTTGMTFTGAGSLSLLDPAHFSFTNTDFPAYTVYLSGIHPHWVSPVFLLLLAGLVVAYGSVPTEQRRRRLALLGLASPLVGLIAFVNTWSLPAAIGLIALVVGSASSHPLTLVMDQRRFVKLSPVSDWLTRIAGGVVAGVLVGALALVWVAPYFLRGLAGSPELGLFPPRSGAWYFVIGYGGFLVVFVIYLVSELRSIEWSDRARIGAGLIGAGFLGLSLLGSSPGILFLGPVLLGGLYLNARNRANLAPVLIVAGAGLALIVELAYVEESAEPGRFNTVYKVYMQTWVLWSVAAGVALATFNQNQTAKPIWPGWRPAIMFFVVIALSIYALGGVGGHVSYAVEENVSLSTDGLAYLSNDHPDYAAAISWLAGHEGQPVTVSAPVPEHRLYQFNASPAASLTGIPTLVGWNHEADYRGVAVYRERVQAIDRIYAGTKLERARTLSRYNVSFIWVGPAEEDRYRLIDYSREPGITVAFNQGKITLYRVTESNLATG